MKKAIPLLFVALAFGANADNNYITTARVVESTPIIETVYEEVEVCRYEYQKQRVGSSNGQRTNNTQSKVLGGVIGGAAGSVFGKGSGRDAAAGVGVLLGSELADGDGLTSGELVGGIAGGIVGNQVGKGSGKTAATAAGVLIGSIVGDNLQNGGARSGATAGKTVTKKVRVCDIDERPKKIITGYDVILEYGDFRFNDIVAKRPGDYLEVNVNVEVVEDRTGTITY